MGTGNFTVALTPTASGGPSSVAFAAAPDLLAELQNIANANPLNWDAPCNDFATFYAWAQSRARAAIAKAVTS